MVENIKTHGSNYYIRRKGNTKPDYLCLLTFTKNPQKYALNEDEIELILNYLEHTSEWIRKQTGLHVNIIKEKIL